MKAIILGSTGLVGDALLKKLLNESRYSEIIAFVRRPLTITHPKLKQIITELTLLEKHSSLFENTDILFCCLGTTIKKAKSKTSFKQVDYEFPYMAAKIFKEKKGKHYLIVTAIGSDAQSSFFYNKVKGELEQDLKNLNLNRLSFIRPSLLFGARKEKRFLEEWGQKIVPIVNSLIPEKYKAVTGEEVANVLLQTSLGMAIQSGIEVETI